MQFWRGKLWIFIALLALCGPVSPLAARVCDAVMVANLHCAPPSQNAEVGLHCAPCCAPSSPAALFGAVSAPLPKQFSPVVDFSNAPLDFVLPAETRIETRFILLEGGRETEPWPPRERFGNALSCRAPPRFESDHAAKST